MSLIFTYAAAAAAAAAAAVTTFKCCLISQFFQSYSSLGQTPKVNFWELLKWDFYRSSAYCLICFTNNSLKVVMIVIIIIFLNKFFLIFF